MKFIKLKWLRKLMAVGSFCFFLIIVTTFSYCEPCGSPEYWYWYGDGSDGDYTLDGASITVQDLYETTLGYGVGSYNPQSDAIPHFSNLTMINNATLTVRDWDGARGGDLRLRVTGTLYIDDGSKIVNSGGYRGGSIDSGSSGRQGESWSGFGSISYQSNEGGGGGAIKGAIDLINFGAGGGGGGFGEEGENGLSTSINTNGLGGEIYGEPELLKNYLGSGGGGGSVETGSGGPPKGGGGGGYIQICTQSIIGSGQIEADGKNGQSVGSVKYHKFGGGGGGSGGAIRIVADTIEFNQISATGGSGGSGYSDGGNGGVGRIRLDYSNWTIGTANPSPYFIRHDVNGVFMPMEITVSPQTTSKKCYHHNQATVDWSNYVGNHPEYIGYCFVYDQSPDTVVTLSHIYQTKSQPSYTISTLTSGWGYFHIAPVLSNGTIVGAEQTEAVICYYNSGPDVYSPTHPNQSQWYQEPNINFKWHAVEGRDYSIQSYYYVLDQASNTIPTLNDDSTIYRVQFFPDPSRPAGKYYFHIRSKDTAGYLSDTTTFRIQVGAPSPTPTPTLTPTPTPSVTPSITPTLTPPPSATPTPSPTVKPTDTPTPIPTPTTNQSPVASLKANGQETYNMPELGELLTLNGSGSYDPEGQSLYYSWREYPGNPEFGLIPPYSHTNPQPQVFIEWPGQYIFMLTVNDGVYNSAEVVVTVNAPGVAGKVCVSRTHGVVPVDVAQVTAQGRTSNTRSDGIFNLVGTSSSVYDLTVSKSSYDTWTETINVPPYGKQIDDIELAPNTWMFTGIVKDYADNPIEGVTVWVIPGSGIADTTDSTGRFTVQQAPEGTWNVTFSKYGYGTETHPLYFHEDMERNETLDQASITNVTGHIYSSGTSLPLSGVDITVDDHYVSTSNLQGYYELPGVASGQYMLVASRSGLSTYRNTIAVPPVGLEWDIEMTGGLYGVYGEVRAGNGNPIEGASIDFQGGAGSGKLASTDSDQSGFYTKDVPYGERTLVVSAPGYPTKTITMNFDEHTRLDVTLSGAVNLVSVMLDPSSIAVRPGLTKCFRAIAHYDDSSTQNVTSQAIWVSGAESIATVVNGCVMGQTEGMTSVTATYGGIDSSPANVEVSNDAPMGDSSHTDFNGDGVSDVAIYRANSGLWAVRGVTRVYFGSSSDLPVPSDYNGDGYADFGIFRSSSGLWAIRGVTRTYFGSASDTAIPADYDGDGCCDVGIFRASSGLWAIRGVTRSYFGASADSPLPGDYNGDGMSDIAIFRGGSGLWAIRGVSRMYFGSTGDETVPGDYNGDGAWDTGIFRPASGLWAIRGVTRVYFGSPADSPVPANYSGSGADSIGIFRGSSGLWAVRGVTRLYFGGSSDTPVTR